MIIILNSQYITFLLIVVIGSAVLGIKTSFMSRLKVASISTLFQQTHSRVSSTYSSKNINYSWNRRHGISSSRETSISAQIDSTIESSTSANKKKIVLKNMEILEDQDMMNSVDKFKAGHELRKQNRETLRQQRVQSSKKYDKSAQTESFQSSKKASVDKTHIYKTRFKLGNGMEVLTAESLLGLVRSTAPFLFPEYSMRLVLDEDEDEDAEVEESVEDNKGRQNHDENRSLKGATDTQEQTKIVGRLALLADSSDGWLKILQSPSLLPNDSPTLEQRVDYFALCLAAHFATCATYVPTDVDSKIRGHCWFDPDDEVLREQFKVLKSALSWNTEAVSKRTIKVPEVDSYCISGHNGEFLGVLCGAWGSFLRRGMTELAKEAEYLIESELERESKAFRFLREERSSIETDSLLLKLAAIMTHNVGDVDQGLSFWTFNYQSKHSVLSKSELNGIMERYTRLAHERYDRFDGEFGRAKIVYKELLSTEGHRNYPLREAKCLRSSPDLMLPLG